MAGLVARGGTNYTRQKILYIVATLRDHTGKARKDEITSIILLIGPNDVLAQDVLSRLATAMTGYAGVSDEKESKLGLVGIFPDPRCSLHKLQLERGFDLTMSLGA